MIVVEDGTGVAGANSYVEIYELQEYAEQRGIVLPGSDEALEALLHKAMDYLRTISHRFVGERLLPDQPLDWPRRVDRSVIGQVPEEIKRAQMVAAIAAMNGPILGSTSIGSAATATRKTVGPITVEYSDGGTFSHPVAYIPEIFALLRPLWGASRQPAVVRG